MNTMTQDKAIAYLNEMVEAGNVVFINNNNGANTINSELNELAGEYTPDVVCDYTAFKFYGVAEVVATGIDAVDCYEASRADEYEHITLCKYADPYEDQVVGIDPDAAREVCKIDPALIYLKV